MRPVYNRDGQFKGMEPLGQPSGGIELGLLEDSRSVQVAISTVVNALATNRLEVRRATALLYGLQLASSNCRSLAKDPRPEPERMLRHVVVDADEEPIAHAGLNSNQKWVYTDAPDAFAPDPENPEDEALDGDKQKLDGVSVETVKEFAFDFDFEDEDDGFEDEDDDYEDEDDDDCEGCDHDCDGSGCDHDCDGSGCDHDCDGDDCDSHAKGPDNEHGQHDECDDPRQAKGGFSRRDRSARDLFAPAASATEVEAPEIYPLQRL